MAVTELGMVTVVKPLQPKNAASPMAVTELGMVTLVKSLQRLNADSPMEVMEMGIIVFLQPVIKVFEAVSMIALQLSR